MQAIIIGAGIGGLTAAIALRQRGIDAQVYERTPLLRDVGAGISLWPNAVKALHKLGLEERLSSISVTNLDSALRRWDGTFLSRTNASELERRFGGGIVLFHRAELLDMLATYLGHANIHLDHAFTKLMQDQTSVTANFANGSTTQGEVLIGADGIHSQVRAQLGHAGHPRYSGYTCWRSVVPFDYAPFVPAETWGSGRRFGAFPIAGNRVYWFATNNAPEGEPDPARGPKSHLLSLFKGWHAPIESLIRAADNSTIHHNDIYDRDPLLTWSQGRVTLLGDAAHPMTPNLGQGACQAIEDALELAAFLSRDTSVESALQDYEAKRVKRTASIVLSSRRTGDLAQQASPFLCRIRDIAFQLTPGSVTYRMLTPILSYEQHLTE